MKALNQNYLKKQMKLKKYIYHTQTNTHFCINNTLILVCNLKKHCLYVCISSSRLLFCFCIKERKYITQYYY